MIRDKAPDNPGKEPIPSRSKGLPRLAEFAVFVTAASGAAALAPAASAETIKMHSPNRAAHAVGPEAQATYRLRHDENLIAADTVLILQAREHVGAAKAPTTRVGASEYHDDMANTTRYVKYPVIFTGDQAQQKEITSPLNPTDGKQSFGYIDGKNRVRIIPDSTIKASIHVNYNDHFGFSFQFTQLPNGNINRNAPLSPDGSLLTDEFDVPMTIGRLTGVKPPELLNQQLR